MRARVAALALLLAAGSLSACSSSGKSKPDCDLQCQSNLAAADGSTLPPGPAFDFDTSKCSQWNQEPSSLRYTLASVMAERLGAKDPKFALVHPFEEAITVACKSYTEDTVKSVATTLMRADDKWPDA